MKLKGLALAFALAFVAAASSRVMTVTNGTPDGTRHPFVGVMIQPIPDMPGFVTVCSGSALSSMRFLTAAHCADPSQPVFVSYKSGPPFSLATDFTPGTFVADPDWCLGCGSGLPGFDTHDVAVVALAGPVNPGAFVTLPAAGYVDTLRMNTPIDLVGYGVQGFVNGGGPRGQLFFFTRYFAPSLLVQSNNVQSSEFIKLTANPAAGGGVCFGDSGGPDLVKGTLTQIAVNSYVTNSNCAGVTYSQRIDLPDILAFIHSI
jgi:Trypsin